MCQSMPTDPFLPSNTIRKMSCLLKNRWILAVKKKDQMKQNFCLMTATTNRGGPATQTTKRHLKEILQQ